MVNDTTASIQGKGASNQGFTVKATTGEQKVGLTFRNSLRVLMVAVGLFGPAWAHAQGTLTFVYSLNISNDFIRILPAENWGFFRESEPVTITTVSNNPIRILALSNRVLYEGPPTTVSYPVGHYLVETEGDREQFVVLPADYQGVSFLGTESVNTALVWHVQVLNRIKPGWARLLSGPNYWSRIQPQSNVWHWTDLDNTIEANLAAGRRIMFTLWSPPSWLNKNDTNAYMAGFEEFCRQFARRYKNKVQAFEVWNEPNWKPTWPETAVLPLTRSEEEVPPMYKEYVRRARAAIKPEAPAMEIVGAGWTWPGTSNFITNFANLNGHQYLDAFTYHEYYRGYAACETPRDIYDWYQRKTILPLDETVRTYRSLFGNLKLYMNEGGLYGRSALGIPTSQSSGTALISGISWYRGMARAVKYFLLQRSEGVELIIPHVLAGYGTDPANNYEVHGLEFGPRGPHPKTSAALMTGYLIDGARHLGRRMERGRIYFDAWQRTNGTCIVFAWTLENTHAVTFTSHPQVQVTDIFGGSLPAQTFDEMPVLLTLSPSVPTNQVLTVASRILPPNDLSVASISAPSALMTWQIITVSSVITNEGPALGPFQIEYFLREPIITGSRITLHRRSLTGIGSNQAIRVTDTIQIPPGLTAGTYSLRLFVDSQNQHLEYNEVNNDTRSLIVTLTPDDDGDQIPDAWEITHGFDPTNRADAEEDPDRDGFNNHEEYLAGTDPRSATSSPPRPTEPAIHRMRWVGHQLELHFLTDAGKTYQIQYRDAVTASWLNLGQPVAGDGFVRTVVDPTAATASQRFYRLKVTTP